MKQVIASLVSISILTLGPLPAPAQVPQKAVQAVKAVAKSGVKKAIVPPVKYPHISVPAVSLSQTILPAETGRFAVPRVSVELKPEQRQQLERGIAVTVKKALEPSSLNLAQIRARIAQGNTERLAQRILTYPNPSVREGMLRNEFVQVALAGHASLEQIEQAADLWRQDIQQAIDALPDLPAGDLPALAQAYAQKNKSVRAVSDALASTSALGLFGTQEDAALLADFSKQAAGSSLAPLVQTAAARALLRLGAVDALQQTTQTAADPALWQGLYTQAAKRGFSLPAPESSARPADTKAFTDVLGVYGKINLLAADPSDEATAVYMNLGRTRPTAARPLQNNQSVPLAPLPRLPRLNIATPEALQVAALAAPAETSAQAASSPTGFLARAARTAQAAKHPHAAQHSVRFFARTPQNAASDRAGILYGGFPLPAVAAGVKKAWSYLKKRFTPAPAALHPEPTSAQGGLAGVFQRASLYLASFVMGLEVATPVIANFGSSFGLSLSDNILVAVATYLPYSLGAFLSNWLKQKIGRKASMNLGLALMGGGFTAGVTLFGLNGAFVPQADALAHFYNILGCITLASTGGVFVHNAVGPMMTDLSAGASELALQKRNANTELSRALGMAASFAFPFLSTKVLGLDWSFTFALPIPLVAAAALGINLARIPNTKPVVEPKPQPLTAQAAAQGIKNRRAYTLTSSLLNNSYIRLLKEEKGVLALLTGLLTMNAVEMSFNNGFLFLLPGLTADPSSQYLFGLIQFAAPFLIGRYLARSFLKWFPKRNMSVATLVSALGGMAAWPLADNVYALTAALFAAEVGISTTFTLAFARSAKNIRTQDRIVSLIVASAVSCAFGPMLLTNLAEMFMSTGLFGAAGATAAAMIGVPSALALFSAGLFKRVERVQAAPENALSTEPQKNQQKRLSWLKKLLSRVSGKRP